MEFSEKPELYNIENVFLLPTPRSSTLKIQPIDAGVIVSVKSLYCSVKIARAVDLNDENISGVCKANILIVNENDEKKFGIMYRPTPSKISELTYVCGFKFQKVPKSLELLKS